MHIEKIRDLLIREAFESLWKQVQQMREYKSSPYTSFTPHPGLVLAVFFIINQ